MLESEQNAHLDYAKYSPRNRYISGNGYSKKTIKTSCGKVQIKVSRDQDVSL